MININKLYDFDAISEKCRWIKAYNATQETTTEAEWFLVLKLVKHTKAIDKTLEQIVHDVSHKHPMYEEEGTLKIFNQIRQRQPDAPLCSQFKRLKPQWCAGCPYEPLVTSPLSLGTVELPSKDPLVTEEEILHEDGTKEVIQIPLPKLPDPYFRGKRGGIYMTRLEGVDADRIYEYDIFPTRRLRDEEFGNESLEIALNLPRDGQVTLKLPNNVLTDQRRFVSALADKGAFVRPREIAPLQTYLIEYAKLLQREEPAQEEFSRFGWRDLETNTPRFVMGDYVISHNGDLRKSTPAPYLAPLKDVISTKGDFDKWKAAFDVYKDISCHAFRFTQMLGFAAPLFALTPFHGLLFNLVGASGTGKSTALKMMASIWGKPNERHILVQDNKIPIFNTIGSLQNIPITCDELTLIGSDTLADIAYAITEGRGKNRADEKGRTRLNQIQWKTLVCGASNMSLYEKLGMARSGNNAHAYRIFEVQASRARTADQIKIDSAIREVEIHYGFAGRLFIAYVIKNIDTVRDLIEQMWGHYAKHYKMATAERFWYMLFACVAVGGSIAKKLGIHDYDVDGIVAWGIDQLSGVRQLVNAVEGDPLSLLSHFMQTNINSTVHIINNQPQNYNNSELNIRMEWLNDSPMRAYLSIPSVKKFCAENNIDYAWFSRKLKEQKIALDTNITKNLGKDTDLVTGLIKAWEIDVTKFPDRDTLIHKPKENSSLH